MAALDALGDHSLRMCWNPMRDVEWDDPEQWKKEQQLLAIDADDADLANETKNVLSALSENELSTLKDALRADNDGGAVAEYLSAMVFDEATVDGDVGSGS